VQAVHDLSRGVSDEVDDQVPVQVLGGLRGEKSAYLQDVMVLVDPLDRVLYRPL